MKPRLIFTMLAALFLAVVMYLVLGRPDPQPAPEVEVLPRLWDLEMEELVHVSIELPRLGKSESWILRFDGRWYFDAPNGPAVEMSRWGGGIPLVLSGPRGNRLIAANATADQEEIYGLNNPAMRLVLQSVSGRAINVSVGNATPGERSYYLKVEGSQDVYSIDYSWFDLLERLVTEPPYPE
jgi:hypothetical protein